MHGVLLAPSSRGYCGNSHSSLKDKLSSNSHFFSVALEKEAKNSTRRQRIRQEFERATTKVRLRSRSFSDFDFNHCTFLYYTLRFNTSPPSLFSVALADFPPLLCSACQALHERVAALSSFIQRQFCQGSVSLKTTFLQTPYF